MVIVPSSRHLAHPSPSHVPLLIPPPLVSPCSSLPLSCPLAHPSTSCFLLQLPMLLRCCSVSQRMARGLPLPPRPPSTGMRYIVNFGRLLCWGLLETDPGGASSFSTAFQITINSCCVPGVIGMVVFVPIYRELMALTKGTTRPRVLCSLTAHMVACRPTCPTTMRQATARPTGACLDC